MGHNITPDNSNGLALTTIKSSFDIPGHTREIYDNNGEVSVSYTLMDSRETVKDGYIHSQRIMDLARILRDNGIINAYGSFKGKSALDTAKRTEGLIKSATDQNISNIGILLGSMLDRNKLALFNVGLELNGWQVKQYGNSYEGRGGHLLSLVQRGLHQVLDEDLIVLERDYSVPENETYIKLVGRTQGNAFQTPEGRKTLTAMLGRLDRIADRFIRSNKI